MCGLYVETVNKSCYFVLSEALGVCSVLKMCKSKHLALLLPVTWQEAQISCNKTFWDYMQQLKLNTDQKKKKGKPFFEK